MSEVSEKAEDPLGLWFNPATCRLIQRGGATYRKIQADKRRREAGVAPVQVGEGGGVRKKKKVSEPTRPPSASLQEEEEEEVQHEEDEEEDEEEEVMTRPVARRVYEPMRSVSTTPGIPGKDYNLRRALAAASAEPAAQFITLQPQAEHFRLKPQTSPPSSINGVSPADRLRKERFWRSMNIHNNHLSR